MNRRNVRVTEKSAPGRRQFGRSLLGAATALVSRPAALGLVAAPFGLAGCNRSDNAGAGSGGAASSARNRPTFHSTDITGAEYASKLALVDHEGKPRTLEDFRGKAVMVFFGFTQCPDVCPNTLAKAAEVKRLLGDEGNDFQVVLVTLDPERDSAAVLGPYVTAFDPSFVALRGNEAEIQAAAREFRVFFQKVPNRDGSSYTIDHTAASYVFDPAGHIRLFVKHSQEPAEIAADIRQLIG